MYDAPVFPQRRNGSLWAISAYFNPAGYRTRKKNFAAFHERLKAQGVPLIVAEAALHDAPFELSDDDADIVLRFRTRSMLWQKERLLNLASKALPSDCDKVALLDTDVCFLRHDWPTALAHALEKWNVVQPYRRIAQGARGYVPPTDLETVDTLTDAPGLSAAYSCALQETDTVHFISGHPGYAIAMRREILDASGLYENMILGGGDSLFFGACFGIPFGRNNYICELRGPVSTHAEPWCDTVSESVKGSVGSVEGDAVHLWHGDRNERFYAERKTLIQTYDPDRDTTAKENGCVEWTNADATLRKNVELYFRIRDEDGTGDLQTDAVALRQTLVKERDVTMGHLLAHAAKFPPGWKNQTMRDP